MRSTSSSKRSDSSIATSLSAVRPRGYCAASHAMHSASVHSGFNVATLARAFRSSGLLVNVLKILIALACKHGDHVLFPSHSCAPLDDFQDRGVTVHDLVNLIKRQ